MVGVAGKSQGCLTCRQRKIRCDLKKPNCSQCQRTKRECGGYVKAVVFLNQSSEGFDPRSSGVSNTTYVAVEGTLGLTQYLSGACFLPRSLDASSLAQGQVLAEFVQSTLSAVTSREPPLSWMSSILELSKSYEALSLAGAAIGYGWTGHNGAQAHNVAQGRQYYLQSVSRFRSDLKRRRVLCTQTTLAMMGILVLYEVVSQLWPRNRLLTLIDDRVWYVWCQRLARLCVRY